jgi:hypothetical protein
METIAGEYRSLDILVEPILSSIIDRAESVKIKMLAITSDILVDYKHRTEKTYNFDGSYNSRLAYALHFRGVATAGAGAGAVVFAA